MKVMIFVIRLDILYIVVIVISDYFNDILSRSVVVVVIFCSIEIIVVNCICFVIWK